MERHHVFIETQNRTKNSSKRLNVRRAYVEEMLRRVVKAAPGNDAMLAALNDTDLSQEDISKISAGKYSSTARSVKQALVNDSFRMAAWKAIGFDAEVQVPWRDLPEYAGMRGDISREVVDQG